MASNVLLKDTESLHSDFKKGEEKEDEGFVCRDGGGGLEKK
jgi:hypothetical protein